MDSTADYPNDTVDNVMKYKKSEADRSGLTESIRTDGVQQPVQLVHKRESDGTSATIMGHGHHRVAVASDISKKTGQAKYVPVVHTEYDHDQYKPLYSALDDMHDYYRGATR